MEKAEHRFVDDRFLILGCRLCDLGIKGDGESDGFNQVLEVHTDGGSSWSPRGDPAVRPDRDHVVVVGKKLSQPRDVAYAARGVVSAHEQLLSFADAEVPAARKDFDSVGGGFGWDGTRRSGGDPGGKGSGAQRIRTESGSAFMRTSAGRFGNEQAELGKGEIHSS